MSNDAENGRLYAGVIPYLALDGAEHAVAFYQQAFGAKLHGEVMKFEGTIANASLEINGGMIMLADRADQPGTRSATDGGHPITMQLVTDKGQMWFDRAAAAGCEVTMPFAPQFWGDTYGRLKDPFGIEWAINEPSAASMAKAAEMERAAKGEV